MKYAKIISAIAIAAALVGCGQRVEVPPAYVGKVMSSVGYKEQLHETSRFRLDLCLPWESCERLVLLASGDVAKNEPMSLLMPKDKLNMTFVLQTTLAVNPSKYNEIFNRVSPSEVTDKSDDRMIIDLDTIYKTYAQQIIRSEAREYLSRYSISDILSNLNTVNAELQQTLTKSISEKTPFVPRFVGLADVKYPAIIVTAQEAAAARREEIEKENAQLEISKVQLQRELQEQAMRRKVSVEKANAEAQVNTILANSMTSQYQRYRELEILEALAKSNNKTFVPMGSLNSIAIQQQIGK